MKYMHKAIWQSDGNLVIRGNTRALLFRALEDVRADLAQRGEDADQLKRTLAALSGSDWDRAVLLQALLVEAGHKSRLKIIQRTPDEAAAVVDAVGAVGRLGVVATSTTVPGRSCFHTSMISSKGFTSDFERRPSSAAAPVTRLGRTPTKIGSPVLSTVPGLTTPSSSRFAYCICE